MIEFSYFVNIVETSKDVFSWWELIKILIAAILTGVVSYFVTKSAASISYENDKKIISIDSIQKLADKFAEFKKVLSILNKNKKEDKENKENNKELAVEIYKNLESKLNINIFSKENCKLLNVWKKEIQDTKNEIFKLYKKSQNLYENLTRKQSLEEKNEKDENESKELDELNKIQELNELDTLIKKQEYLFKLIEDHLSKMMKENL